MSCIFFSKFVNTSFPNVIIWSSYRRMLVFCMALMDKERYSYFVTWELAAKIVISAINKNPKSIYVMFIVIYVAKKKALVVVF